MTIRAIMEVLTFSVIAFLLATHIAFAQSRNDWGGTAAWIEIHEPDEEHRGARAGVTHHNEMVHGPDDNGRFILDLDGFQVEIIYRWNIAGSQAERFTVIPPPGYVAIPSFVDVEEGATETIWIYGATS